MDNAQVWLNYFASALLVGLEVALPVLLAVAVGGLTAAFLQALIGYGDVAIGAALRLAAAALGMAVFGLAMSGSLVAYWTELWGHLASVLGGAP